MNYNYYGVDLWENDVIANDEFDSDQLDEDESYSWASGITDPQDNCAANWRGWKSLATDKTSFQSMSSKINMTETVDTGSTGNRVIKLVDLCARYVALNMPFELVETFAQPVPEELQLKITFASFPDNPDDIRLYSCLANGNADDFARGEQLYISRSVRNILQIGFHLSAEVLQSCNTNSNKSQVLNVAVVCDRKRVTSCHCSCSKASSWCSHIVAVCLSRIHEPHNVELRAPVSESLSKLQRDQLQKFAQYLISELPQQILPTAQKLLDELLKSNETSINRLSGAPDPTAGSSTNDMSVWCLDEQILQENIQKTLSKFVAPSPHVVSDIDYLAHASSAASAEYTSLLRPLRGREPEGMWNLISIVKEMFRKHDKNSMPLLKIITNVCVSLEPVLHLWFLVKVSPLYNDKSLFNTNTNSSMSSNNNAQRQNTHTPPVHQACAILLDEIVSLWRIACLNPFMTQEELCLFNDLLHTWHKQIYDKLRKFCNSSSDKLHLLRRLDPVYFGGFEPAIGSCQMTWSEFRLDLLSEFRRMCLELLPTIDLDCVCHDRMVHRTNDQYEITTSAAVFDETKIEMLFARCEALYCHGFNDHASVLARMLADYLLSTPIIDNNHESTTRHHDQQPNSISHSTLQTSRLWRCAFICTILLEQPSTIQLAFRIGLHAFEMPRQPVGSKALEVKLFNQEQDLILLLKRIPITSYELTVIRDRTQKLIKMSPAYSTKPTCTSPTSANYVPIMLANFIFDILCLNDRYSANSVDEQMGFEAAVCALGYKPSVSESDYPIYCEGIRRQKGDLALSLLLTFKDDQGRLLKILDKILCKDVHVLFKNPFNPFQPNLKKIQTNHFNKYSSLIGNTGTRTPMVHVQDDNKCQAPCQSTYATPPAQVTGGTKQAVSHSQPQQTSKMATKYTAMDSVSSGWEESENETSHGHNTHLLETKYRLNRQQCNIMPTGHHHGASSSSSTHLASSSTTTATTTTTTPSTAGQQPKKSSFLDSSAPETTSSDNSPAMNRKSTWTSNSVSYVQSQSQISTIISDGQATTRPVGKFTESDDSGGESICSNQAEKTPNAVLQAAEADSLQISVSPWADSTFTESTEQPTGYDSDGTKSQLNDIKKHIDPKLDPSIIEDLSNALQQCNTQIRNDVLSRVTDTATSKTNLLPAMAQRDSLHTADVSALPTATATNTQAHNPNAFTGNRVSTNSRTSRNGKNKSPIMPNQPTEALAHFMFDFSKTILNKAGGTVSTSVFLNQNNMGPHRNLHTCAFLIALYALGLHNCVINNWLSRTYSSHVSWISGQAAEIGYQAICILIECWEGHLTPAECALLADRVSRGRDTMAVKAAAELALSSLQYSYALNLQEIQRALIQCKEQSNEMLQNACHIVENSVKDGHNMNLTDILFEVAKRWDEMYTESVRNEQQQQQQTKTIVEANKNEINLSSIQQRTAAVVVAAAAAAIQSDTAQSPIEANTAQYSAFMQHQAPFAFAVQPLPYPSVNFNTQQGLYVPAMYTAYGTIMATPTSNNPSQNQQQPNIYFNQQQQQQKSNQPSAYTGMNSQQMASVYQASNSFIFQNQLPPTMHQIQQQKPNEICVHEFLLSAFRVGMMALEALPRRVENSHQNKHMRNPSYGDNVKWLWNVSIKLGANSLQQFCQAAANVIQNPFLIQDLVFDSANHLSRYNPAQFSNALRSPMLNILVQRCLNSYFRCCMQRIHHMTPNDHEDFISMVVTARSAFFYSGNISSFSELLQNLRRSKACKKELWTKLCSALANANTTNYQ